jgi:hypothetical protein
MIAMQKVHSFATALDYNDSKLHLKDETQRAEVLDHNFLEYNKEEILKEVKMLNALHPRLKNDGYHVALSFSEKDNHLSNADLIAIADAYKKGMGFGDDHLFVLYKHNDGEDHEHIHVHLLLHRLSIDEHGKARVVSDSNNFQRSEVVCRDLEERFNLEKVRPSKEALDRAPTKDELEMIQRTGVVSDRLMMQAKVKEALGKSNDIQSFIHHCKEQSIYLLFNQSETTGRVSGVTYVNAENGFIATGQKLGNQYKWNNLSKTLNYGKQSRDGETVRESTSETRFRFKELLGRRTNENSLQGSNSREKTRSDFKKSRSEQSSAYDGQQQENRGRSKPNSSSKSGDQETIQEVDESISNQSSSRSSTVASTISGLLNSFGSQVGEDEEAIQKRRRKRR